MAFSKAMRHIFCHFLVDYHEKLFSFFLNFVLSYLLINYELSVLLFLVKISEEVRKLNNSYLQISIPYDTLV